MKRLNVWRTQAEPSWARQLLLLWYKNLRVMFSIPFPIMSSRLHETSNVCTALMTAPKRSLLGKTPQQVSSTTKPDALLNLSAEALSGVWLEKSSRTENQSRRTWGHRSSSGITEPIGPPTGCWAHSNKRTDNVQVFRAAGVHKPEHNLSEDDHFTQQGVAVWMDRSLKRLKSKQRYGRVVQKGTIWIILRKFWGSCKAVA